MCPPPRDVFCEIGFKKDYPWSDYLEKRPDPWFIYNGVINKIEALKTKK
jgi:hypothetical protein